MNSQSWKQKYKKILKYFNIFTVKNFTLRKMEIFLIRNKKIFLQFYSKLTNLICLKLAQKSKTLLPSWIFRKKWLNFFKSRRQFLGLFDWLILTTLDQVIYINEVLDLRKWTCLVYKLTDCFNCFDCFHVDIS